MTGSPFCSNSAVSEELLKIQHLVQPWLMVLEDLLVWLCFLNGRKEDGAPSKGGGFSTVHLLPTYLSNVNAI